MAHARAAADAADALVERRQRDDGPVAHRLERLFQLALAVGRIERHDDRARLPDAELGDQELRTVGQQQRDAIAPVDAQRQPARRRHALLSSSSCRYETRRTLEEQRPCGRRGSRASRRGKSTSVFSGYGSRAAGDVVVVVREPAEHDEDLSVRDRRACGPATASRRLIAQSSISSSAFCACSRFSAWSKTTDCGDSKTSAVTSSPRCAGRQCMKSAFGRGVRHQRIVHLVRHEHLFPRRQLRAPRPSTPTRPCRRRRRRRPLRADRGERTHVRRRARRRLASATTRVRELVALGRRDVQGDAEHARRVRERRRDVVAVADEGHASVRGRSPHCSRRRIAVGERLTRVLLVGQRVDDVQARRRIAPRSAARSCAKVRTTSARTQRSRLRATSSSGSRPPANSVDRFSDVAAELFHRDLERRARPQRRLLEEQRHVRAVERPRGRRCRPSWRSAFSCTASRSRRSSASAEPRSRTDRKSLTKLRRNGGVHRDTDATSGIRR